MPSSLLQSCSQHAQTFHTRRVTYEGDRGTFTKFTETRNSAPGAARGGFSKPGSQAGGHYLYDLGPSQAGKKIQVAEPEFTWIPSVPFWLSCRQEGPHCPGLVLHPGGERKLQAQEWSGWNPRFSKEAHVTHHPLLVVSCWVFFFFNSLLPCVGLFIFGGGL